MKKHILIIIISLISISSNGQLLKYGGKDFFLNGANICWKNYGWDFGDNSAGYNGGNGYDAGWWESTFSEVENYKGNTVRIWIHCKGEHNPLFDVNGKCIGINSNFYNNIDDLLQRAENHNLMVILCLFDFHIVDVGRQDIIKDTSKTNAYINNALIPLAKRYDNQCNLLAWEIINEPEWIMQGIPGGGTYGSAGISISQMQRFVGMCTAAIHSNSTKMVTVGSASLKWSSDILPAAGNFWSNAKLQTAAYDNSNAYLDFYQIHYYDWMSAGLSPYSSNKSSWGLNKPVLVGETGNEGFYTYQQQFDYSYSNGFAGCLPWAYQSGGAANWNEFNSEMLTFGNAHATIVGFDCSVLSKESYLPQEKIQPFINASNEIQINGLIDYDSIHLLDIQGKVQDLKFDRLNENSVSCTNKVSSGLYLVKIKTQSTIFQEVLVIP